MSLAKAIISGMVFRAVEKRFTTNNVPVSSFTLNISDTDQTLIRVIAKGGLAEIVEKNLALNDKVVVDGRLQNAIVKNEDGSDRYIVEIDMNSFEKLSGASVQNVPSKAAGTSDDTVVKFSQEEFVDDLIGEDELPF